MIGHWSQEEFEILKENYPHTSISKVAEMLPGKTYSAVKTKIQRLGLNKSMPRHKITPEEHRYIIEKYGITQTRVLAQELGISIYTINNIAFKNRLKKSPELIKQIFREKMQDPKHPGRKSWLKKGNTPVNKGKKQIEYMSPEAIERTKATRFHAGQTPANHKPIGYERIDKDGYVWIKIREPNVFRQKHRVTWEKHRGKVPKGYNVQFRDGNRQNCDDIENLYLISRSDQMKFENSMYVRYPKEIQLAIQVTGALNRQINKQLKSE